MAIFSNKRALQPNCCKAFLLSLKTIKSKNVVVLSPFVRVIH